ncbi:hypothetical protein MXB_3268 [Myxobolus squamalis]|nr:hypothetical protein MXB_3268 [Myxobolus squamalis]
MASENEDEFRETACELDNSPNFTTDETKLPRCIIFTYFNNKALVAKALKKHNIKNKVETNAKQLLFRCFQTYINVAIENVILESKLARKKIISPEHVISSISRMGFTSHKPILIKHESQLTQNKEIRKSKFKILDKKLKGQDQEELLMKQMELINDAKLQTAKIHREKMHALWEKFEKEAKSPNSPQPENEDYD